MYATRDLAGKCCQPFEVPTLYPSHAKASWKSAHRNPSNLAPKVSHKIDIWYQYPCDQITWIQVLGIWQELIEDWDGELFADGLDELVVRDHEKLAWSGLFHKYVYATADQHKYYERRSASNPRLVTDLNGNQYIYIWTGAAQIATVHKKSNNSGSDKLAVATWGRSSLPNGVSSDRLCVGLFRKM